MRNHDNAKKEWTDEELKKLYETHERLLDLVSLFCYVPRAKYLPLGPTRYIIFGENYSTSFYFSFISLGILNYLPTNLCPLWMCQT